MSLETARSFLLWCAILNYGLLLIWAALIMLPHDWLLNFWGRRLRLSSEQFEAINFAGMVLYKVGIILFNLVPYVSLCVVG
jgi:hypothetical protein